MSAALASTVPERQLRSTKVGVLLRPLDAAELDRRARESGITRSELFRWALVQGLAAEGVRAVTRAPRRLDPRERLERAVAVKLTAADSALIRRHRGSRSIAAVVRECVRRELMKGSPGRLPAARSRETFVSRISVPLADTDLTRIRERLRGRGAVAGFIRRCIRRQLREGERMMRGRLLKKDLTTALALGRVNWPAPEDDDVAKSEGPPLYDAAREQRRADGGVEVVKAEDGRIAYLDTGLDAHGIGEVLKHEGHLPLLDSGLFRGPRPAVPLAKAEREEPAPGMRVDAFSRLIDEKLRAWGLVK